MTLPGGDPFALPDMPDGVEAPAEPAAYTHHPYAPDAGFHFGATGLLIGGGAVLNRSVTLDNGHVVTAGRVTTGGTYNVVLNRQSASGQFAVWPASGQPHVIHQDANGNSYTEVNDLKLFGDRLYVMATRIFSGTDTDVDVLVFDLDGHLITRYNGMGTTAPERGGGLAFYQVVTSSGVTNYVIVVGEQTVGGRTQPVFSRASWTSPTLLTRDASVGLRPIDIPDRFCAGSARPCSMSVAGVVTTGSVFLATSPQRIYIGGSIHWNGDDWDFAAMRVTRSGTLVSDFGDGGIRRFAVDADSDRTDLLTGIAARRQGGLSNPYDEVFLAGRVSQRCNDGIGIVKLADAGGAVTTFGGNGTGAMVIGGSNGGSGSIPVCIIGSGDDLPSGGIGISGEHLVIAGQRQWRTFDTNELRGDVLFAAVRANGGALADLRSHRAISPHTNVREDSIVYGMSVDSAGRVVVAGNMQSGENSLLFLAGRFIADRIFGDDLEAN
ncbi:hypothetical protein [Dokdonella sp.]|uniref:hypothetical protein n=1 Tax=Dokdonella sp. TaxID=2291710 RepID=UPI002D7EEF15|nr:hypothetical protein [Dokdonella sp.]